MTWPIHWTHNTLDTQYTGHTIHWTHNTLDTQYTGHTIQFGCGSKVYLVGLGTSFDTMQRRIAFDYHVFVLSRSLQYFIGEFTRSLWYQGGCVGGCGFLPNNKRELIKAGAPRWCTIARLHHEFECETRCSHCTCSFEYAVVVL
jgi:hypothetical protein